MSSQHDQNAEQHYVRALELHAAGDEARAEKEFRDAVAKTPGEDKYVRSLALFYIARSRYEDAIEVIREHVKCRGVTALGYELEAELLFQQKLYDPALEAVLGSLKLSDHNARMHQLLGSIYIIKRQDTAAVLELRKAAELNPNHAQTRYFLGRVLYSTGDYAAARDQFLACLKLQPGFPKALENLGLCFEALKEDTKAIEAYQEAIALEKTRPGPKRVEPHVYYGVLLGKLGQSEQSLSLLREAVTISPKSFLANFEFGKALFKIGQIRRAESYFLTARELDPKFSRTYYFLGKLNHEQNRSAQAKHYFERFKELDKDPTNREFPLTDR